MSEELEKRLEVGMFGKPQIKKDEIEKYLGSFRERVYLTMTLEEMRQPYFLESLKDYLNKLEDDEATLHLHAEVDESLRSAYTKLINTMGFPFTMYSSNEPMKEGQCALVICTKKVVNIEDVDIQNIYPNAETQFGTPKKEETKNFFQKLFD